MKKKAHNNALAASARPLAAVFAMLVASPLASALGLGDLRNNSYLGEPLNAELTLVGLPSDYEEGNYRLTQLSDVAARKLGIELIYSSYKLQFSEQQDRNGVTTITVTSDRSIVEPFVNVLVQLEWPGGSVYREYSLLFDARPAREVVIESRAIPQARSQPAASIESGSSYRVQSGDTLSGIAQRLSLPAEISIEQATQDLHSLNPRAFVRGDINRLIAGANLSIPQNFGSPVAAESLASLPRTQAGTREQSSAAPSSRSNYSSVTPQGRLSLSEVDQGGERVQETSNEKRLRAQIDGTQEMIDMLVKENAELRERVEKIESSEYLNTLTELVAMQRKQIDDLRREMRPIPVEEDDDAVVLVDAQSNGSPDGGKVLGTDSSADPEATGASELSLGQSLQHNFWAFLAAVVVGVSALLSLVAAAFWYLVGRKRFGLPAEKTLASDLEALSVDSGSEMVVTRPASVEARKQNTRYPGSVTPIESRREKPNRSVQLKEQQKRDQDEEVKQRIRVKKEEYESSETSGQAKSQINDVQIDVLVGLDEEINELLSMAKIYCSAGKYSEARAILNAQQRIEADPRLADALRQIDELENSSSNNEAS